MSNEKSMEVSARVNRHLLSRTVATLPIVIAGARTRTHARVYVPQLQWELSRQYAAVATPNGGTDFMNEKNGQANGGWKSVAARTAMIVDGVVGPLDAFVVFLLLLLAGTWMQRIVNL
ncbi:hypothetical protein M4951_18365 [Blastopirellula sp. J2-11]|uniref:hypothetical protein n=1 Tax=Blastopirellula sp. J2-11 TaxID=2943192 RepID=UPI0021CA091E|nr:hypothetical protein [Blastopirellula sp. J2-11]UUO05333.1 hypothetical protein M4951_18365 [Blastopirellula sp. J2-11]